MGFCSDCGDMIDLRNAVRRNGWSDPRFQQVLCWVYMIFNIVTLFAVEVPSIQGVWATILAAIASVVIGAFLTLLVIVTSSDPTFDSLKQNIYKSDRIIPQFVRSATHRHVVSRGYCFVCFVHNAKHCKNCNKCIPGFDHHCPWINNCIGRHNHKTFYGLLILWLTANVVMLASCTFVFINCFLKKNILASDFYWISFERHIAEQIILGFKIAFLLLVTGYLVCCVKFHRYLLRENLTTYRVITSLGNQDEYVDDVVEGGANPEPVTDLAEMRLGARMCLLFLLKATAINYLEQLTDLTIAFSDMIWETCIQENYHPILVCSLVAFLGNLRCIWMRRFHMESLQDGDCKEEHLHLCDVLANAISGTW